MERCHLVHELYISLRTKNSISVIGMNGGDFGTVQQLKSLVQELPSKEHLRVCKNMALILCKDLLVKCCRPKHMVSEDIPVTRKRFRTLLRYIFRPRPAAFPG